MSKSKLAEEGLIPLGHREHNSTCAIPEALKGGLCKWRAEER